MLRLCRVVMANCSGCGKILPTPIPPYTTSFCPFCSTPVEKNNLPSIKSDVIVGDINIVSNESQEVQIFSGFEADMQGYDIVGDLLNPQISDLQIWVNDYVLGFEKLSEPEYSNDDLWLNLIDNTDECGLFLDIYTPKGEMYPRHRLELFIGNFTGTSADEIWKFETISSMSADFIFGMLKLMLRRDYEKLKTILDWKPPDN